MLFEENDYRSVTIANDVGSASTVTVDDLVDGQGVVVNESGDVINVATSPMPSRVKLVYKKGGKLYFTESIDYKTVDEYKVKPYAAPQYATKYIGYNGSTGQVEGNANIVAGTDYTIVVRRLSVLDDDVNGRYLPDTHTISTGVTATQSEIVDGFASLMGEFYTRPTNNWLKVERVTDATPGAATTGNIIVKRGSKQITAASDIDNGGAVVGDYITLSGVPYKFVSINTTANTAVLDQPYQGFSGTVTDANVGLIANATAIDDTTNWGLKFTVLEKEAIPQIYKYDVYDFDIWHTTGFVNTTLTESTESDLGQGTYDEVADVEAQDYTKRRMGAPSHGRASRPIVYAASPDYTYDLLTIVHASEGRSEVTGKRDAKLHQLVYTAIDTGTNVHAGDNYGIVNVLDAWLTAKTGITYDEDANLTT
jgi:hypothetical protein